ncbi:MAG: chemotaxis protein CheW [Deltaproteobacteria bacterium]|nr:chemotaxis protein CheW [Deltaproteobacteria bacterium]
MSGERTSRVDWAGVYARLDHAEQRLQGDGQKQVTEELAQRARALARSAHQAEAAGRSVVVLAIAGGRYGLDACETSEVLPLGAFTPIPKAPPFVAGVVHRRGEILLLVDTARLLGLRRSGIADLTKIVVVGPRGGEVGLLVEASEGIESVDPASVRAPVGEGPLVEGLAGARLVLLAPGPLVRAARGEGGTCG